MLLYVHLTLVSYILSIYVAFSLRGPWSNFNYRKVSPGPKSLRTSVLEIRTKMFKEHIITCFNILNYLLKGFVKEPDGRLAMLNVQCLAEFPFIRLSA